MKTITSGFKPKYFWGAVLGAAGTLAGAALSSKSTKDANAATAASNERINREQIEFAKNAVSYQTADRLRSGLSPLDSAAAETPALSGTDYKSTDFSSLGSGITNALQMDSQRSLNNSAIDANNAKAADDQQAALSKKIENTAALATLSERINALRTDYENLPAFQKANLSKLEQEYKNLVAQNDNITADTSLKKSTSSLQAAQTSETKKRTEVLKQDLSDKIYNSRYFRTLAFPTNVSFSADWKTSEVYRFTSALQNIVDDAVPAAKSAISDAGSSLQSIVQDAWDALKSAGISGKEKIKEFMTNFISSKIASAMSGAF